MEKSQRIRQPNHSGAIFVAKYPTGVRGDGRASVAQATKIAWDTIGATVGEKNQHSQSRLVARRDSFQLIVGPV